MSDNQQQPQGGSKKDVSFLWQVFGALWIVGWCVHLFAFSGNPYGVGDIIASGAAIIAMFSPVYLSIILDKIKDLKAR